MYSLHGYWPENAISTLPKPEKVAKAREYVQRKMQIGQGELCLKIEDIATEKFGAVEVTDAAHDYATEQGYEIGPLQKATVLIWKKKDA